VATSTDPLGRAQIGVVARDTGDRYVAPRDNAALRLARSLQDVQPAVAQTLGAIADKKQADAEARAKAAAIENSGAALADAVRLGKIRATQNPWFVQAYNRESAAIRGQDALSKLQTDSASWEERNDTQAFAKRWHSEVGGLMEGFAGDPDSIKGFTAAEGQASQQALATNQAYNTQRIFSERKQNLSALAADALQKAVLSGGGTISGSNAALALAPAKAQWIATGGTLDDWNEMVTAAVTTASYSIRSPGLIDLLKAPELTQGPREGDASQYGDGADHETPDLPAPLKPVIQAPEAKPTIVSGEGGARLAWPAQGRITNDYAQHKARGSRGVDIAVPIGTKLRTSVGGTAQIGNDPRSGLFVRITSPDGKVVSSLAHLSVAHVTNGQHVAPGEVVAFSGQSGHATGPHVHWRLKVDGKDVDPLHYTPGQQALTDDSHAEVQAGNQAPALAVGPAAAAAPAPQPILAGGGPSLYDMAGVADKAESDRYRISSALRGEAGDRLQALTNQRKLDGLKATDQLYATFGTKLLTGDVDTGTIVATMTKGGYSPQVIAEAMNNVRAAVGDTEGLANARLSLNGSQPDRAKALFDLATEGRVNGYTEEWEHRVGDKVIGGELTAQEAISLVGSAVSRTETIKSADRAQTNFDEAHPPGAKPGTFIKKASQVNAGVDTLAATSFRAAQAITGKVMGQNALRYPQAEDTRISGRPSG
jgi:murein DD-endopeptidase MepM/ murein hydrolase activator NlpD